MKIRKDIVALLLKEIARKSVCANVESRCMFLLHQPKMPLGLNDKNIK